MRPIFPWSLAFIAVSLCSVSGCGPEWLESAPWVPGYGNDSTANDGAGPDEEQVVPDFSLLDVNENSERKGQLVSPRDYRGQVSLWYFGHAT
jgi:hypothetical protein